MGSQKPDFLHLLRPTVAMHQVGIINTVIEENKMTNVVEKVGDPVQDGSFATVPDAPPAAPVNASGATGKSINSEPSQIVVSAASFHFDHAQPIDPKSFPNPGCNGSSPPTTIPNVRHLLQSYKIIVRYDVIKKKLLIYLPGHSGTVDNADNVAMSQIISLATLNGMSYGRIPEYVTAIGDRNQANPVMDWIMSKPWDGADRLQAMCDTLITREDFPKPLKQQLIHRWLISSVAAVLKPSGFKARGVLTLQGPQSIGKTSWISSLVPDPILRDKAIKLDHHLDASNKDTIISAVSHWIVEIGELDSSFRKDIARLKGFLTSEHDKVRRPYGRADSEYPRRTVFCATVNDQFFLVDPTGNSRWWTLPVIKANFNHGIEMQQLFAQMAVDFAKCEPWWLTKEEEVLLETFNNQHRVISAIHERILEVVDVSKANETNLPAMMASELLRHVGIDRPTNTQCKECASILRELFGESKRINGQNKWRVPLIRNTGASSINGHRVEEY